MQQWRPREDRKTVRISVRVRTDAGWIDATVRNVSVRGMQLHSLQPLRRNEFVEITRGRSRVVGRIVWSQEAVCGLRAQDRVDIDGLLAAPGSIRTAPRDDSSGPQTRERRSAVSIADRAYAARRTGQYIETAILLVGIACVAGLGATSLFDAMNQPFEKVRIALAGRQ